MDFSISKPYTLKICRICFAIDSNLRQITDNKMNHAYEILTGLPIEYEDTLNDEEFEENLPSLPSYLCIECAHHLLKFMNFRTKSIQAYLILCEVIKKYGYITSETIKYVNGNKNICSSNLGIKHNRANHYDLQIKYEEEENSLETGICEDVIDDNNKVNDSTNHDLNCLNDVHGDYAIKGIAAENNNLHVPLNRVSGLSQMNANDETVASSISSSSSANAAVDYVTLKNMHNENDYDDDSSEDYDKSLPLIHEENVLVSNKAEEKAILIALAIVKGGNENKTKDKIKDLADKTVTRTGDQEYLKHNLSSSDGMFQTDIIVGEDNASNEKSLKSFEGNKQKDKCLKRKELNVQKITKECGKVIVEEQQKYLMEADEIVETNLVSSDSKTRGLDKSFNCKHCDYKTNTKQTLIEHSRIHLTVKPLSCDVCHQSFVLKSKLINHMKKHFSTKSYCCDICKKSFKRRSYIIRHLRTHSGERPYSCHVCGKTFGDKGALNTHMRLHFGNKRDINTNIHSCEVCHKTFKRKGDLTRHLRTHSGEKPYSCDKCMKSFNQKCNLLTHMRLHMNGKLVSRAHGVGKSYFCYICKVFVMKNMYQTHLKTHYGEEKFSCGVCKQIFETKIALHNHFRKHKRIDAETYTCRVCKKICVSESALLEHYDRHTKTCQSTFSCDICGLSFVRKFDLMRHLRVHTGEKPYSCKKCARAFSQKSNLKNHMRTHWDED